MKPPRCALNELFKWPDEEMWPPTVPEKEQSRQRGSREGGTGGRLVSDLICWWSCHPISGLLLSVSGL